jgi:hypothetical protein
MQITPTAKSQGIAGVGFWIILWSLISHLEQMARYIKCDQWIKQDAIFAWINRNKTLSLVGSEVLNLTMHSPSSGNAVLFCLGGTCINTVMIFVVIPIRQGIKKLVSR